MPVINPKKSRVEKIADQIHESLKKYGKKSDKQHLRDLIRDLFKKEGLDKDADY